MGSQGCASGARKGRAWCTGRIPGAYLGCGGHDEEVVHRGHKHPRLGVHKPHGGDGLHALAVAHARTGRPATPVVERQARETAHVSSMQFAMTVHALAGPHERTHWASCIPHGGQLGKKR